LSWSSISLFNIDEELLKWIFELCETGMAVSLHMTVLKAGESDASFIRRKTACAQYFIVHRFVRAHN
jgi:hypothetical protein